MARLALALVFGAALGAGIVGGIFYGFSSFVMAALGRLAPSQGAVAMRAINVSVINPSFMLVFLGTALICLLLTIGALVQWQHPSSKLILAASLSYLVGTIGVTMICNVPLNDQLERNAELWTAYIGPWTTWNHVRTVASLLAAALFIFALVAPLPSAAKGVKSSLSVQALLALAPLLCGGCNRYWVCDEPSNARRSLPERLTDTGLYADSRHEQLAASVHAFRPQFPFWSDGATKRRFIRLPAGSRIDTSDMDSWVFPVGTELWKEFAVAGAPVETRFLRKVGAGDDEWASLAYAWNAAGTEAIAAPTGAVDARGTKHDVPAAGQCHACHGGRKSFVLGFSAIQLAYAAAPGEWDLAGLSRDGVLTAAPTASLQVPGTETERAALGYLHGNCGHCHNSARPQRRGARCYDPENNLDFWLQTAHLRAPSDTPTYQSGRGLAFEPGAPDDSRMIELASHRGFLTQMPPLGTEVVDERAVRLLRSWIAGMQ